MAFNGFEYHFFSIPYIENTNRKSSYFAGVSQPDSHSVGYNSVKRLIKARAAGIPSRKYFA